MAKKITDYTPQEIGQLSNEQLKAIIASERETQATLKQFADAGIGLSANGLLMVRVDNGMPKEHKRYAIVLEREYWENLLANVDHIRAALDSLDVVTVTENKARKDAEAPTTEKKAS